MIKNISKNINLNSTNRKLLFFVAIYAISSIIFLILLFNAVDKYLKNQTQNNAKIMASAIDYYKLSKLNANKSDLTKGDYYEMKNLLKKLNNTSKNFRFVYLMGVNDENKVFFYVDSETIGSPDESAPGDIYEDCPKEAIESFKSNDGKYSEIYEDKWGQWISAYYPVRDFNNKPIALLGIDNDAKEWNSNIREFLFLPFILVVIGLVLIIINHYHRINKLKLLESKSHLDAFFSSDSLYVVKIDDKGDYTYVNQSFQNRFSWINNGKSLIGFHSLKTVLPEDHQRVNDIIKLCLSDPGFAYQIYLKKPDENSIHRTSLWDLTSLRNPETNEMEILGIGRDVTNVEHLENELLFERELFSSGPVVTLIWENDEFWTVKYTSKNVQSVLGYNYNEFVCTKYSDYIHPDDLLRINNELQHFINNKINNFEQSYRIKKKDGEYIWIFDLTKVYRDNKGIITEIRGYIFDQTKNKEYEAELQKQNVLLEGIIKGTNAGTWDWNVQTGEMVINDRWTELIGYTLDELMPITVDTWANTLHPDDLSIAKKELDKHFSGKTDYYDVIFRQMHKNGNYVWINSRGKVISKTTDGKPIIIQGIHIDLTEHIQALSKLKESENLLRSFISNVNGIAFLVDKDGIFRLSEGLGLNGLNMKPKDVIGKSIYEVYRGERELLTQIEETLSGKSGLIVLELNQKYFETNFSPVRNDDGVIISAIGISIDITEKHNAEENIKKLNIAIEQSPVSIFITNRKGIIEYANKEFSKTSGYSKDEYLGKNPKFLSSGKSEKTVYEELWKTISQGKIWQGELLNKTKYGELIWESEIIAPILDNEMKIKNFICIKENITEKKKLLDELIKAKNQIEESDKLKTAFLQNMSHEIRTPLNGIIGFSRLLELEDLSKEEISEFVGLIKNSSNRLLETINNILELSRIETNQMNIEKDFILVNELINDVAEDYKNKIKNKGIELTLTFGLELENSIIYSDKSKLRLIINNLLNNALKFTKEGKIEVGYTILGGSYTFFVKDTGIGIKEDSIDKIFDRFFQADISISRNYEGTGLGLSLCKEYINLLGGHIGVESIVGKGSEFYFTIKNKVKY